MNALRLELSQSSDAKTAANKPTRMAAHSPEMQKVLDRLARELVEYFESGMVVATFQDGATTKNALSNSVTNTQSKELLPTSTISSTVKKMRMTMMTWMTETSKK